MVNPYRQAKARAHARQIFAALDSVETISYTAYVKFLNSLRLKSGPPQIDTYAEWAKGQAESRATTAGWTYTWRTCPPSKCYSALTPTEEWALRILAPAFRDAIDRHFKRGDE